MKSQIVVSGFADTQTVFLARAALARIQEELAMATEDIAIVLRGAGGQVSIVQALNLSASGRESSAFWEVLADLLFAPGSSVDTTAKDAFDMYAKAGIDTAISSRAVNHLELCNSALLVRTSKNAQRERVVGVLRGFDCQLVSVPLSAGVSTIN